MISLSNSTPLYMQFSLHKVILFGYIYFFLSFKVISLSPTLAGEQKSL